MKTWLRQLLLCAVAASFVVFFANCGNSLSQTPDTVEVAQANNNYRAEVAAGITYYQQQAVKQLPLVQDLVTALESGNLEAAKKAYVEARPPYEQIEVLAGNFEQEDSDIDARPYAFDKGELSEEFKGFHRIEAYLYRDGDVAAAIPYAKELVTSVESLIAKLNDLSNFDAASSFDGMIALSTEVPAKKISSEEETWSDQSILIFENNWIGIYSQFQPFESKLDSATVAEVKAAYDACMASIKPFLQDGQAAALPYSSVTAQQRGKITQAAYQFLNGITKAGEELGLV